MIDNPTAPTNSSSKAKYFLGAVLLIMLLAGFVATYWLTQQSQDIRQQAGGSEYECSALLNCPTGQVCVDAKCVDRDGSGSPCSASDRCPSGYVCVDAKCEIRVGEGYCGDGVCGVGEAPANCPADCGLANVCTSGSCVSETSSCSSAGLTNGSGTCEGGICCGGPVSGACTPGQCGGNNQVCCTDGIYAGSCVQGTPGGPTPCLSDSSSCVVVTEPGTNKECVGTEWCTEERIEEKCCDSQGKNCKFYYKSSVWGKCVEDDRCGGDPPSTPTPTPSPTPSPTPTPPGPQCLNIAMDNPGAELGDQTTFTCGQVAGVDHYVFRVMDPDGIISDLAATGRISAPYLINQGGQYSAQCQICTSPQASSCYPWETLPTP